MKKKILERYRRNSAGELVVDIATAKVSDLYDDFDKQAPFIKKELDYDLVEYLVKSAHELGREPFSVNFSFNAVLDDPLKDRVRHSIQGYFDYLLAKNSRELHVMMRTSLTLFLLGLVMLSASVYINHTLDLGSSVFKRIMAEGLVIASWVSMWEAIAGVLLNWQPTVRERLVYRRLKNAELTFNNLHGSNSEGTP
ncbi:MAG TPA: hypothetical protein VLL07_04590 [Pontiella sp.]|nr:hypothetical protein [Pontiella sp.]